MRVPKRPPIFGSKFDVRAAGAALDEAEREVDALIAKMGNRFNMTAASRQTMIDQLFEAKTQHMRSYYPGMYATTAAPQAGVSAGQFIGIGDRVMPFGKYQGVPLKNLPIDYVQWAIQHVQFRNPLIANYLRDRIIQELGPNYVPPPPEVAPAATIVEPPLEQGEAFRRIVKQWYSRQALKYHPDRGNKTAEDVKLRTIQFSIVAECHRVLLELLEKAEKGGP